MARWAHNVATGKEDARILLEIPPLPAGGLSDVELLRRLGVLYGGAFVKSVEDELLAARTEGGLEGGNPGRVAEIHARFI